MTKSKVTPTQKALNLWAIILIIWSVYRANLHLPEWFDEFIAKPIVFILPVWYYITKIEKGKLLDGLWVNQKKIFSDILYGLGIGGIFFVTSVLANSIKLKKLFIFNSSIDFQSLLLIGLIALATAVSEEVLSRGFILKRLYEESKNKYTASFFASILFFFLHVPMLFTNVKITGNLLLLFMATDLILSLVNSFLFLERKSLVLPILVHALYNASLVLFI
jgi:membrane protease YdiL (CAAX protease family)